MVVTCKDICKLTSLDSQLGTQLNLNSPTHVYAFWEGFNNKTKMRIAELVNASTSVQVCVRHRGAVGRGAWSLGKPMLEQLSRAR